MKQKMPTTTPYLLRTPGGSSDEYYATIAAFADRWIEDACTCLDRPVNSFLAYLDQQRTFPEAAFEMLVLGVLLREHGAEALLYPLAPAWVLTRLVEAQCSLPLPAIEQPVKAVRGFVNGLVASPCLPAEAVDELPFGEGAAAVVARLVGWLRSQGQNGQADRLDQWAAFISALEEQEAEAILACCLLLADDFAAESAAVLGQYTAGVEKYIEGIPDGGRWRYDAELITRTPVEYHLGMLGTEILSRAYRDRFRAQPRKIVIVPDCLSARSERVAPEGTPECEAQRTDLGGRCVGCTPGCRVHILTNLGKRRGFEVYILPDEMRGIGLSACTQLQGVGVVGVACALTNWDAGWQVTGGGVPAQGVLLDYPGCKSHWSEQGKTTDVNITRVVEIASGH